MNSMNSIRRVLSLAVCLFAAAVPAANAANKECVPIGGEALGQFYNGGTDVIAAMSGTWNAARGSVKSQRKSATGMQLTMEHVFSTSDGAVVRTRDVADLTAVPDKKDTYMLELGYTVVESFGRFKGFTGTFNSYGLINLASGEALVRYFGEICK